MALVLVVVVVVVVRGEQVVDGQGVGVGRPRVSKAFGLHYLVISIGIVVLKCNI